jgi:hypothetical protein
MYEDLRQQAENAPIEEPVVVPERTRHILPPLFLGMTPPQRFIISLLLLIFVCLLSSMCLLATGKVVPPFM